ncbi:MAG: diguanylate cyclase [Cyanobacteria bacterium P01_H01_bin.121]
MRWPWTRWLTGSLPGLVAGLVLGGLQLSHILEPLEDREYKSLFRLRGQSAWDTNLVVIEIDDQSLAELGWFPWSRDRYTELLRILAEAQASVVVFDILFTEPTPLDSALVEAIEQQGGVVLAQAWDPTGAALVPEPSLAAAAITAGHIHAERHSDGNVGAIMPLIEAIPSLGVAATQAYSLVQAPVIVPALDRPLYLNWPGATQHSQHYSFSEVLSGQVPFANFQDKLVFVGATAVGFDRVSTPFNPGATAGGVYVHVATAHTILQDNALSRVQRNWIFLFMAIAAGPGLSLLLCRRQRSFPILTSVALAGIWFGVGLFSFIEWHLWLPIAFPILVLITTGMVTRLWLNQTQNRQLKQVAYMDQLTQIANRRCFDEFLDRHWQDSQHKQPLLALILCDIDYFKRYNDTYGHSLGDQCLQQVAQAMQITVNSPDYLVARYGGEEFAVILPHTDSVAAYQVAVTLCDAVRELQISHEASDVSPFVTLSLGVAALIPSDQTAPQTLVQAADQALYRAKQQGRNQAQSLQENTAEHSVDHDAGDWSNAGT